MNVFITGSAGFIDGSIATGLVQRDHGGAFEALIAGLKGSNKIFLHTSGSSIVGDGSGGEASDTILNEMV